MLFSIPQDNRPSLPAWIVAVLATLYLLAGVTGHDPWKTEDAIHIGIAHGFASQGGWLFPRVAGEAWAHTAPLYHWVAAALGENLGNILDFHNAARLATPLFGAVFLLSLAGAAHTLHGQLAGRSAPLLAIGTLGLLAPLHEAQPAVAGLACAAFAYWGAALVLQGRPFGAWMTGIGLGLAFPAHGLVGLIMAFAVLPAPTLHRDWKGLGITLLIALPLAAAWPVALNSQSPELWNIWWHNELAEATTGRSLPDIGHIEQITWAAWPVLPIALWMLWLCRKSCNLLVLPLTGTLLGLLWYLSGPNRTLSTLPLLLPLILIAAAGIDRLRRGAANAFDWFGVMTFTCAAALIWLGASAQALDWPPKIARNFDKLAPGHQVEYGIPLLIFTTIATAAWVASWRLPRAPWRPVLHWSAGMTLMWVLIACFWLSWIDHGKSYRQPALALKAAIPATADCIERGPGIGSAQRASLDYFVGIRTESLVKGGKGRCNWRLTIDDKNRKLPVGWLPYWQGQRPGDRDERWYLDRRNP